MWMEIYYFIENMSKTQQEQLHINEQNMDYAGRNFYSSFQYTNSVLVHVKKDPEDVRFIAFGIQMGDNDKDTYIAADAKEWTVFDDFRLLFAAKGVDTDLVLDEDAPNLDYLNKCSNTYQNAILHLNKTIQTDLWTSIILPVNLTKNQFTTAFGANARLAKLEKVKIPEGISYASLDGLRLEARQKLDLVHPHTIGQASRISGVNPTDIEMLLLHIKKGI